jgi:hypothetical protein
MCPETDRHAAKTKDYRETRRLKDVYRFRRKIIIKQELSPTSKLHQELSANLPRKQVRNGLPPEATKPPSHGKQDTDSFDDMITKFLALLTFSNLVVVPAFENT